MSWKSLALVFLIVGICRCQEKRMHRQDDEVSEPKRKTPKGEVVVEKFVETLMTSEKYLKMIESVERKLHHLDASFHDRSNVIMKYMVELLKVMKASTPEESEKMLRIIKNDIDKIYHVINDKESPMLRSRDFKRRGTINKKNNRQGLDETNAMKMNFRTPSSFPQESADFTHDNALDARLGNMETSIKNIQSGVETVVTIINEVKNRRQPKGSKQDDRQLSGTLDALGLISEFRKTIMSPRKKCDCSRSGMRVDRSERFPSDCYEIQMQGFNISGIYKIKPDDSEPFYVLCDLVTAGGGWTVFQNRFDGTQDFYKGWADYKHGFGNLAGEFWLGLEKLSYLTNQKLYELRVEMGAGHGQEGYAGYSVFTVGPEHESYRISTLGTYRGNAGDSLTYHAGQKFSTLDADNDEWSDGSCSAEHGGAWWYKECDKSNLNGKYTMSPDENRGQTIYWISFKGPTTPLMKTKMMIRPLPATRPTENDHVRSHEFVPMKTEVIPKEHSYW